MHVPRGAAQCSGKQRLATDSLRRAKTKRPDLCDSVSLGAIRGDSIKTASLVAIYGTATPKTSPQRAGRSRANVAVAGGLGIIPLERCVGAESVGKAGRFRALISALEILRQRFSVEDFSPVASRGGGRQTWFL